MTRLIMSLTVRVWLRPLKQQGCPATMLSSDSTGNRLWADGTARDIADAVWFLCSELSSFITGQAITVDGGL